MKDPEWQFYEKGESQNFEDISYYKRTKYKDKINKTILAEYCLKLGLDIETDKFWTVDSSNRAFVIGGK
jgi:hypothetical protein